MILYEPNKNKKKERYREDRITWPLNGNITCIYLFRSCCFVVVVVHFHRFVTYVRRLQGKTNDKLFYQKREEKKNI